MGIGHDRPNNKGSSDLQHVLSNLAKKVLMCKSIFTIQESNTMSDDRAMIEKTIQYYIDGAISGKGDDMKPAFHADATIFGYIGDDLFAGPIQNLFEWHDGNGAATELDAKIADIDIVGTVATVRLELDNWTGHKFTDLFTLLKFEGTWKIMNKVFYLHP